MFVSFNSFCYALTLADLEVTVKEDVKEFVAANLDDNIEYITIEELEGEEFEVLEVTDEYVYVVVDGVLYILEKE